VVTIEQLRSAYSTAVINGDTIEDLAKTLGLKMESLQQRLTALRGSLRKGGLTEQEVKAALPSLKRRTGPRASTRSTAIAEMIAAARAKVAADAAEAEAKALAELEAEEAAKAAETFAEAKALEEAEVLEVTL
jgi:hypothetical protein